MQSKLSLNSSPGLSCDLVMFTAFSSVKSLLKNEPTSQFSTGISGFPAQKVGSAAIRAANCPISASLA
ncbi:hypothetical protein, partial [Synechococcus sp. CCY9202]|uniref:hypothetical protein n=1 Tax=Synechococcus sp. CCY9202 TaxID=174698 RepID=UPI002B2171CC